MEIRLLIMHRFMSHMQGWHDIYIGDRYDMALFVDNRTKIILRSKLCTENTSSAAISIPCSFRSWLCTTQNAIKILSMLPDGQSFKAYQVTSP